MIKCFFNRALLSCWSCPLNINDLYPNYWEPLLFEWHDQHGRCTIIVGNHSCNYSTPPTPYYMDTTKKYTCLYMHTHIRMQNTPIGAFESFFSWKFWLSLVSPLIVISWLSWENDSHFFDFKSDVMVNTCREEWVNISYRSIYQTYFYHTSSGLNPSKSKLFTSFLNMSMTYGLGFIQNIEF